MISPSDKLKVVIEDGVAILTIDNPAANTWDLESLPALADTVTALNEMTDVRALVITGQGDKFFSAGADLKQFASGDPEAAGALCDRPCGSGGCGRADACGCVRRDVSRLPAEHGGDGSGGRGGAGAHGADSGGL